MAFIWWPAWAGLRSVQWNYQWPRLEQTSEFTGRTRIASYGHAASWTAECELPPMGPTLARDWRGFMARLGVPGNMTRLVAVEQAQPALTPTIFGAGQTGTNLALAGLPASSLALYAGALMTVPMPSGIDQLVVLAEDLTADAAGQAIARLSGPLREVPANGSTCIVDWPYAVMRGSADLLAWGAAPGHVYQPRSFVLVEAI